MAVEIYKYKVVGRFGRVSYRPDFRFSTRMSSAVLVRKIAEFCIDTCQTLISRSHSCSCDAPTLPFDFVDSSGIFWFITISYCTLALSRSPDKSYKRPYLGVSMFPGIDCKRGLPARSAQTRHSDALGGSDDHVVVSYSNSANQIAC